MQAAAEYRRVEQSHTVRPGLRLGGSDFEIADPDRTWLEDPDGARIASNRRRHVEVVDAKRAGDLTRVHAVGHERREGAVDVVHVERAEVDETTEHIVGWCAKHNSIGHDSTCSIGPRLR